MSQLLNSLYVLGLTGTMLFSAGSIVAQKPLKENIVLTTQSITNDEQKLVDKVLTEYPSPYVSKVIYDHDKSQFIEYQLKGLKKCFETEEFWKELYLNGTIKPINNQSPDDFLKDMQTNNSLRKSLEQAVLEDHKLYFKDMLCHKGAVTPYTNKYAVGELSPIFIFSDIFEQDTRTTKHGTITFSHEDLIKEAYIHECFHAEHNANRIPIGKDFKISKNTYDAIKMPVISYLGELITYLSTYEFFKEKKNEPYAEFLAAEKLIYHIILHTPEINQFIKSNNFSDEEANLIKQQNKFCLKHKQKILREYNRLCKKLSK